MRRALPWIVPALAAAYFGGHLAAYALGMTPAEFFRVALYWLGFAVALAAIVGGVAAILAAIGRPGR